jgi:Fur family ferric uptake transcriptional regulator
MSCGERLAKQLRERGFRVTPQRRIILETIAHTGGHLSVQEVYLATSERLPGLNVATIYRTVDSLHKAGMIDVFSSEHGPDRFSLRDAQNPHGHLVCRKCGQILEVDLQFLEQLAKMVHQETQFIVDANHLTMFGLCRACWETEQNKQNVSQGE